MLFRSIPARLVPAVDEIYQLNDIVDLPAQKPDLVADAPVVGKPEGGQPVPDDLSLVSEHESFDTVRTEKTSPSATTKPSSTQQVQDQHIMVNHLDIDSDEFKIAVHVPGLGMDRMLDSMILHGKLNDLLERGLIPHDAARAAYWQAKRNCIDR